MTAGVRGRHWLIDCSDCRCDASLLQSSATLEARCLRACRDAGLRIVGSAFHQFQPTGVTGVVLLAESHLSVHTWPVERFAAIDVYVCNHAEDNAARGTALAQAMASLFAPLRCATREIVRDSVGASLAANAANAADAGR